MSKLESMVINDSGFAFDPFTGETYTINECGVAIMRLLRTEKNLAKIVKTVVRTFDVAFETAYTDVLEFRNQLKLYGLLGG